MDINVLLFDDFETLDAFGPVEVFGAIKEYNLRYLSPEGGMVSSVHGVPVLTEKLDSSQCAGTMLIPGGFGVRALMKDEIFVEKLRSAATNSSYCLTVCTGSALLAKTGLLKNRQATSNKQVFDWVKSTAEDVIWKPKARWVSDGKFYTASGVSAGIDMALGFVCEQSGLDRAVYAANYIEYIWNRDKDEDPFSV